VLPVDIAFEPASLETNAIVALNYIIDVAFSVDIFLNFRTTIVNDLTGDEITDSKVIAKSYLKGRFFLDLLATLPFDEII
jgi:Ion transport protein